MATRPCPYCAEEIQAEAVVCRYCRSRLVGLDPARWVRDHPERRVAGVAAAVAHGMAVPLGLVRLAFVLATFFHLAGLLVYVALWLVIPPRQGEPAVFERAVTRVRALLMDFFGGRNGAVPPPGDHTVPGGPRP